jgi:hypothetical protein
MLFCLTNLFLHFDQVSHLIYHAPQGVRVFLDDALVEPVKTERPEGAPLGYIIADATFNPGNTQFTHRL